MRFSLKSMVSVALFIALFSGFQGGIYFFSNRIQELGILCVLIMFAYGAVVAGLQVREPDLRWNWWVFTILPFIAYTFVLPAQRFSANAQVDMVPSLFASREFLMALLCPALYFMGRLGYEVERMERVLVAALVVLMLSYIVHYKRMNLEEAYFSTDYSLAGLVTFDPWRGYRLKPPSFAFYLTCIISPILMFQREKTWDRFKWGLMCAYLLFVWGLVLQRSAAASLVASALAYHFFFARKPRMGVFFVILPAFIVGAVVGVQSAIEQLSTLDPETDGVRYKAGMLAWNSFLNTPLFGFGQQSNFTITEQRLFWYKFYSADLGLIGILFKYGGVGAAVYIFFSIFLIQRMARTNWVYLQHYGRVNHVMLAMLIVYLAFALNIMLIPAFTYIPGITAGSFGIAFSSLWLQKIRKEKRAAASASMVGLTPSHANTAPTPT